MKQLLALFFALLCQMAPAQTSVKGVILDSAGLSVAGANVVVRAADHPDIILKGTFCDESGNWEISALSEGKYLFSFSAIGFQRTDSILFVNSHVDFLTIHLHESAENIDEIVVEADLIHIFGNKEIVLFSEKDKQKARSGIDLMQSVPQISLNRNSNSLSTVEGQPVLILVNGQKVEGIDLMSLSPHDITKAEYYTQPPARYSNMGVGAVLMVTTKRSREKGGYLMTNLQNGFTTGYGTNIVHGKYSFGNNDVSFKYFVDYRDLGKNRYGQAFSATLNDGVYSVEKKGLNSKYSGGYHKIEGIYSYVQGDSLLFIIKPVIAINPGKEDVLQRIVSNTDTQSLFSTMSESHYHSPSVDIYFAKKIANDQEVMVNVVNTWYDTESERRIKEYDEHSVWYENNSLIHTKTYSIISEIAYTKKIKDRELSAGAKHLYKKSDEKYTNVPVYSRKKNTINNLYAYIDFSGTSGKWYYAVGIGGENSWLNIESDKRYFGVKPTVSLTYTMNNHHHIRFHSRMHSTVPEMSMLTTSNAYIDTLFISRGNSRLKPYYTSSNSLSYIFKNPSIYLQQSFSFFYMHKPHHFAFRNAGEYIEKTYIPIDYSNAFKYGAYASWNPTGWLTIAPYYGVEYQTSSVDQGKYNNWFHILNIYASVTYRNFTLSPQVVVQSKSLEGALLRKVNNYYAIDLSWNKDNLSITLGSMFLNAPHKLETMTGAPVYYRDEKTWNDFKGLSYIQLVYTLPFGKNIQRKTRQQITNTDNDTGVYDDNKAKQ
jgi:hypothetical protein